MEDFEWIVRGSESRTGGPASGVGDVLALAERLGFRPDPRQTSLLTSTSQRLILNCTRQWGKSTVTALKVAHHALTRPESLSLIVSPTGRQSAEFLRKVKGFLGRLQIRARGDGANEISIVLPNGARVVGLPGRAATTRGYSAVSLLIVDEAAYVTDEQYGAVQPMMATVEDAVIWLLSTPVGKIGFFYEEWANGGDDWERIRVPATECSRISQRFLDFQRRSRGEREFAREYLCEFQDGIAALFPRDLVNAAFTREVVPLFGY